MKNKLPVLSYTFLRDFENCPRKAHHLHVLKDLPKDTGSPAMLTGIAVHKALEHALKSGDASALGGNNLKMVQPLLGTPGLRAEAMLGLTRSGNATGFFDADVWLRGKLDVLVVRGDGRAALLLDWKTGKVREDPAEMAVQAVLAQAAFPALRAIVGAYVWLEPGKVGVQYQLDPAAALRRVQAQAEEAEASTWEPTPNPLCGWCRVDSCEFNRRKER